jgi:hypothetical protein
VLEREAERQLAGVGDAALGEWREHNGRFFHLRRRLTAGEERRVGPVLDIRRTPEAVLRAGRLGPLLAFAPADVVADEIGTVLRAMTSNPQNSRSGTTAPAAGPGSGAAADPPSQAAAAAGANPTARSGTRGTLKPASGPDHPSGSLAASPAPGATPSSGAGGQVEPPQAPARAAAPEEAVSGAAHSSPPSRKGRGGGDRIPAPGVRPGSPVAGSGPPGGAPESSSALPGGKSPEGAARLRTPAAPSGQAGQAGLKAWHDAEVALAAAKRNGRGRYLRPSPGARYRPGTARRLPPGGAP